MQKIITNKTLENKIKEKFIQRLKLYLFKNTKIDKDGCFYINEHKFEEIVANTLNDIGFVAKNYGNYSRGYDTLIFGETNNYFFNLKTTKDDNWVKIYEMSIVDALIHKNDRLSIEEVKKSMIEIKNTYNTRFFTEREENNVLLTNIIILKKKKGKYILSCKEQKSINNVKILSNNMEHIIFESNGFKYKFKYTNSTLYINISDFKNICDIYKNGEIIYFESNNSLIENQNKVVKKTKPIKYKIANKNIKSNVAKKETPTKEQNIKTKVNKMCSHIVLEDKNRKINQKISNNIILWANPKKDIYVIEKFSNIRKNKIKNPLHKEIYEELTKRNYISKTGIVIRPFVCDSYKLFQSFCM